MLIPFDIKNAIDMRRSARSYKMERLAPDILNPIQEFASNLEVPFLHQTTIRFFKAEPTRELYFSMNSPPNNVAFLSETGAVSISKTGFVGELLILMAQSVGVATCWYGHYRLSKLEALMPHLSSAEQIREANLGFGYSKGVTAGVRAICISPLGYYEGSGLRLLDRITAGTASFKRKEIRELLTDPARYDALSDDIKYALDLGRKAPSAANAQMWRFGIEDDNKTITIAMPQGYKHIKWEHPDVDIGICACHVWLGLLDQGYAPKVDVSEEDDRAVWRISI